MNNAFWLNTPPERLATPDKPDRFEIDIVEAHYPNSIHMTLHNWMGKHTGSGAEHKASADLSKDFHTYALEWDEKELTWYYDGKKVRTLKHTICKAEEQVLFSTKVIPFAGKAKSDLEGKSMDVDYVRVFRKE